MSAPAEPLAVLAGPDHRGALVVIDVQRSFGDPAMLAEWSLDEAGQAAVASAIEVMRTAVDAAREIGVPLVWVALESSPTEPWRGSNWLAGRPLDATPGPDYPCVAGAPGAEWYGVEPRPGETVVTKPRYSGFHRTDLEETLARLGVTWVTLAGLTTECCVGSTAFDAIQRDIPTVVLSDATAAYDKDTHDAALRQLAANAAVIASSSSIIDHWRVSAPEREAVS